MNVRHFQQETVWRRRLQLYLASIEDTLRVAEYLGIFPHCIKADRIEAPTLESKYLGLGAELEPVCLNFRRQVEDFAWCAIPPTYVRVFVRRILAEFALEIDSRPGLEVWGEIRQGIQEGD